MLYSPHDDPWGLMVIQPRCAVPLVVVCNPVACDAVGPHQPMPMRQSAHLQRKKSNSAEHALIQRADAPATEVARPTFASDHAAPAFGHRIANLALFAPAPTPVSAEALPVSARPGVDVPGPIDAMDTPGGGWGTGLGLIIQLRLVVTPPSDPYEAEANDVATTLVHLSCTDPAFAASDADARPLVWSLPRSDPAFAANDDDSAADLTPLRVGDAVRRESALGAASAAGAAGATGQQCRRHRRG